MDWKLTSVFSDWRWLVGILVVLLVLVAISFFKYEMVKLYEKEREQEDDYD